MIKVYCIKQCYLPMRAICISMRRSAASSGRQKRHTALEQTNLFWNHPGFCCLPQAVALFHCAWTVSQPLPAGTFATPPTILEEADIDVNSDESNCENFILNCSRNRRVTRFCPPRVFNHSGLLQFLHGGGAVWQKICTNGKIQ